MTRGAGAGAFGAATTPLQLLTLGTARLDRVQSDGSRARVPVGGKVLGLLVYLSAQDARVASREHLADLLWGDESPEHARGSLRQALFVLRRSVTDHVVAPDGARVSLTPGSIAVDRDKFLDAVRTADWERILAAYGGAFCAGLDVGGAREFDRWVSAERDRLRRNFVAAALAAIKRMIGDGDAKRALEAARRVAGLEPSDPDVMACLFDALAADGAVGEARERIESFIGLVDEVPRAIADRVKRLTGLPLPVAQSGTGRLSELGQAFVGREALFAALLREAERARAGEPRRCLLVGVPGVGKTRVLDELDARMRLRGARVIRVRCHPAMRDVPFAAVADLARGLCNLPGALGIGERSAEALVSLLPELSTRFRAARFDHSPHGSLLLARRDALTDLVSSVAEERLVVILVDDIQNADEVSRQLMAAVVRATSLHLLEVWGMRPGLSAESLEADLRLSVDVLGALEVRLVMEAVAALPSESWTETLVERLHSQSRGLPQMVLQLVRWLSAQRLLATANGRWTAANPDDLLAGVASAAGLDATIAELPAAEVLVLRLLAGWRRPMDERDLVAVLESTAFADPSHEWQTSFRRLESLGLVQTRDASWAIAHDTVADGLARLAGAKTQDDDLDRLLRYWCVGSRLTPELLDHLSMLCGSSGNLSRAKGLVRAAGRASAVRGAGLRGRRLVRAVANASGHPAWEKPLHDALGLLARRSRLELAALGVAAGLVLALGGWLTMMLRPELVLETEPIAAPVSVANTVGFDLIVQPRVSVQDRFGRKFPELSGNIRARATRGLLAGDTVRRLVNGRAQFARLGIETKPSSSGAESETIDLEFRGPWYIRGTRVRVRGAWTGPEPLDYFGVQELRVNGMVVADSLTAIVSLGDSVHVELTFEYSALQPTANYIVGASPTWGRRDREVTRLAGLPRPVLNAWRTVSFSLPSSEGPGVHYIIVILGLEESVDHLFSGTNWTAGAPVWYDGNDIVDEPADALDELRRTGLLTTDGFIEPGYRGRQADSRIGDRAVSRPVAAAASPKSRTLRGTAIRIEFTPR